MLPEAFQYDEDLKSSFEPVAPGWYEAEIVKSEINENKAKTGKYLKLEFKLIGEEVKNRKIWVNLNLWNPSETAVQIAKRDFNSILAACGLDEVEDSAELHGIPMMVKVTIREATASYPATNDIKAYTSIDSYANNDDDTPFN